tara:strand:+ start:64 stop:663 length:600 start_codon:yes stop_codon:yes gene_type:complete
MKTFETLTAKAAYLGIANIDTDMIIPKQYLRTIKRTGLGIHAFDDMRYLADGSENPDFALNQNEYKGAEILITGENFGCGSSREHAPWALADMGFRCIIAPSFADIFYNNSFKNGILLITLNHDRVAELAKAAKEGKRITVNLQDQLLTAKGLEPISFDIDPFRKHCLLNGLDDIGLTMAHKTDIEEYEAGIALQRAWL